MAKNNNGQSSAHDKAYNSDHNKHVQNSSFHNDSLHNDSLHNDSLHNDSLHNDHSESKKKVRQINVEDYAVGFRQVREAHQHELIDDYLELIADLRCQQEEVRQVDMVACLGVSQPTVAKMLKRLVTMGLVEQIPWRGISLTAQGEKLAEASRQRHQIVEHFLLAMGVSAETARRDAEGIEHHASKETLEIFQKFVAEKKAAN